MTASGVRLARMTDTDELGAINVAAWRDRLGDILQAEVLDQLRPDDLALVWAGAILNPPTSQHRLLVATHDESARGYAAVGPCADADADAATADLFSHGALPPFWWRYIPEVGDGSRARRPGPVVTVAAVGAVTSMTGW